ncbi:MAG: UDP-N-acetylmuramoyl-L-alanine--D-glutamate ligase [Fimbriimonadales bacterium]
MKGARVAILGAARSGVAAAKGVLAAGGIPTLYDRRSIEDLGLDVDVPVVGGWDAPFSRQVADLVVTSPGVPMQSPVLLGSIASGVPVIGEIELAYRIAKAPIVAITGTNGKSSTTAMAYLALKSMKANPILCGNIYGSGYEEIPLTEAALLATPDQVLVAEISSFQLEWVERFRPRAAAITNITEDHLDRYGGSQSLYAATKRRIYRQMEGDDTIVLPQGFEPMPENATVRTFGSRDGDAWSDADAIHVLGKQVARSRLPFDEPHNLLNAQAALLLAVGFGGLDRFESACEGLEGFAPLDNRLEDVGERDGVRIVNNTMCTNPAAVIASSESLTGRQHLLIGGRRKGLPFGVVGEYLRRTGHRAYLYGADGAEIAEQMGGGFPVFETLQEAFAEAAKSAHNGEVIMLAPGCASQDQFEDFRHRGEVFKNIAKEWLYR